MFVLKYARNVFYENRFDNALLEMRGLVVDKHNRIIVRPFKKVFNYSERIAKNSPYPIVMSDERMVDAVVKVNGFWGYVRMWNLMTIIQALTQILTDACYIPPQVRLIVPLPK